MVDLFTFVFLIPLSIYSVSGNRKTEFVRPGQGSINVTTNRNPSVRTKRKRRGGASGLPEINVVLEDGPLLLACCFDLRGRTPFDSKQVHDAGRLHTLSAADLRLNEDRSVLVILGQNVDLKTASHRQASSAEALSSASPPR